MHYAKVKREGQGKCNICLNDAALSWDHVPPKGSYDAAPREIRTVLQVLTSTESVKPSTRDSQSGVKFRTICKPCNEWLGHEVDPTYIDFTRQIGLFLKSSLSLPKSAMIQTKPNRLLRSILAHLVAAKAEIDEVVFDRDVRAACCSLTALIPDTTYFYYWVYPHAEQVILRDVGMLAERGRFNGSFMFCQLLKSYPVAFLVANIDRYEGLFDLNKYRTAAPDDIVEVPLLLSDMRPLGWPETPAQDNVLFGGQAMSSSVVATARAP